VSAVPTKADGEPCVFRTCATEDELECQIASGQVFEFECTDACEDAGYDNSEGCGEQGGEYWCLCSDDEDDDDDDDDDENDAFQECMEECCGDDTDNCFSCLSRCPR
jgi:hypothetical protein